MRSVFVNIIAGHGVVLGTGPDPESSLYVVVCVVGPALLDALFRCVVVIFAGRDAEARDRHLHARVSQ